MRNLLSKIDKKYGKVLSFVFLAVFGLLKILFWFIFICLFLLQTLIILNILQDIPIGVENAYKAIILYVVLTIGFIISIFVKKKFPVYIFACGMIILFLHLSSLPDLSSYFGYFDGLD